MAAAGSGAGQKQGRSLKQRALAPHREHVLPAFFGRGKLAISAALFARPEPIEQLFATLEAS